MNILNGKGWNRENLIQIKLEEMNNFLHLMAFCENVITDDKFKKTIKKAKDVVKKGNINRKKTSPAKRELDWLR